MPSETAATTEPQPSVSPRMGGRALRAALVPLRHRSFRNLWAASIVSHLGAMLQTVAAAWLMLELTGSALWVALVVAAPTLPLLVVAMPAGAMADLLERRRVVLLTQVAMAATAGLMAGLYYAGRLTPSLLLALALVMGTALSLSMPSWQAMVPDLVPNAHVASAVALNSAAFNVARALGPAVGGAIVATAGPGPAFVANAVSYLGLIVAVWLLPRRARRPDAESMATAIAAGLRYARFAPSYRWLLLVAAGFGLASAVVQAVLPTFTVTAIGGGAETYGILLGAMGAGALAGAVTRPAAAQRLGRWMVPGSICLFGLAGILLGLSRTVTVAAAAMAVSGVLWVWVLATLNATTQLLSPGWVRGRIMSLYTLSFMGFLPLGAVLAGVVADVVGPAPAMVALSASAVALGIWVTRFPLPLLADVRTPAVPEGLQRPRHPSRVAGGPVMIFTTWVIADDALPEYLAVMDQVRRVRLRTGAYRWRLYRSVAEAHRMTEVFLLHSWEHHLRQHDRMDAAAAEVIQRARAFDVGDGPVTEHLAAIDVSDPQQRPDWVALVAIHEDMHRTDGSLPLPTPEQPAGERLA